MQKLVKLISTFFYIGYLPRAPGTYASLVGVAIYFLIKDSLFCYVSVTVAVTVAGFLVSGMAEKAFSQKDARCIVIDEVCGMLLCFFLVPFNLINLVLGFALFRIFDITKPYPAKRIQNLKGSAGIMLDDIIAAVYANIILHIFNFFSKSLL